MARRRTSPNSDALNRMSDEELLQTRICDLGIQLEGSNLEPRIAQVYDELSQRGIRHRPHCWLSDEWYSPSGIPGIAIPFYLAHPRLVRLERRQLLEVEGGTRESCLKILRHEAGHAIDTAYRLSRRPTYRRLFGNPSRPYPRYYQPQPYSKQYVLHLDLWYAQSHPVEDFAETFAVWLRPNGRWRNRYRNWPAIKKLDAIDTMMASIRGKKPAVTTRRRVDPVHRITKTLGEHYEAKRSDYGLNHPRFYDRDLRRLFSAETRHSRNMTAARFLTNVRSELRRSVAQWTGVYQYTIDQVLSEMISRCRELKLRIGDAPEQTKRDATILLTVQTMNYLHEGKHRIAL
ncbi:putative zinc-binding metallopeptidase [Roseimaritima sediminicola]|uniref:putative zinc-binding metallopeptidase n=1 Tax=Roseimaritima sediminicola TaxID=2662066 RepID=UPI00129841CD|nr:putative zinc-binding metallopeptidase [Roseimaritima sediminicola]